MKTTSLQTDERGKTPIPKSAYKFVNPIMKAILRSPIHGLLSHAMMVLAFKGRKSGKTISTPVGYIRNGNSLIIFTFGNWWVNLQNNAEVTMRLQGRDVKGRTNIVGDLQEVKKRINLIVEERGEKMAKGLGFERVPENASDEEIRRASQNLTFIQIDL